MSNRVKVNNSVIEEGYIKLCIPLFAYRAIRVLASTYGLSNYLYSNGLTDETDAKISEFLGVPEMQANSTGWTSKVVIPDGIALAEDLITVTSNSGKVSVMLSVWFNSYDDTPPRYLFGTIKLNGVAQWSDYVFYYASDTGTNMGIANIPVIVGGINIGSSVTVNISLQAVGCDIQVSRQVIVKDE